MEDLPPSPEPLQEAVAPPPGTSLLARLLNVFAMPGAVFEEVKLSPFRLGNWLVPSLLLALVWAIFAANVFSQPELRNKWREQLQKGGEAQVKAGKARPEDVQKEAKLLADSGLLSVLGAGGGAVIGVLQVLWWAFVLWLLGRVFLKAPVAFPKAMEVAGLALMIGALGAVVSLLLTVKFGHPAGGGGEGTALADFDPANKSPVFLAVTNLFAVWQMAVAGMGLAKLAGVPFVRAFLLVFIFWCLQIALLLLVGAGGLALS